MIFLLQLLWLPFVWNQYLVGQFNDDASYLALARSLALGYPYQDLFEIGAPAATRFPPGYPLALFPLQLLFPQQLWMARIFSLFCSLAVLHLLRKEDRHTPWLLAANPFWVLASTFVMSESLFTLLTVLYLQSLPHAHSRRHWLFRGMSAALCYYVRNVGLALVPATLLWMRRRPLSQQAAYLLGFALAAGPHLLLSSGYSSEFGALHFNRHLPAQYGAVVLGLPPGNLTPVYLGLFLLALYGLARKPQHSLAAAWTLCYLLVMLVWPYSDPRFALPILPWLLLGLPKKLTAPLVIALIGLNLQQEPPAHYDLPLIPQSARLASTSMLPGLYQGIASYAQSPADALDKEWEWDQGLLDQRIDTIWLPAPDRDLEPTFQARYTQLAPNLFRIKLNPRAILLHSAARHALQQERYTSAAWLFQQSLRHDPRKSSLHSGLATALAELHQPKEAEQAAQRALQLDPDNGEAKGIKALSF
jgi:hypothetical protein